MPNDSRHPKAWPANGSERHTEDEREGSAPERDRDGAADLVLGHEVTRVGADDRPEHAVRDAAEHAGADDESVGRRDRRERVAEREHRMIPTIIPWRGSLRVRAVSGVLVSTTVNAKTVTRSPIWASDTPSDALMSGSRPVGIISLLTDRKTAPASTMRPTQGKAGEVLDGDFSVTDMTLLAHEWRSPHDAALPTADRRCGSTARRCARPGPDENRRPLP